MEHLRLWRGPQVPLSGSDCAATSEKVQGQQMADASEVGPKSDRELVEKAATAWRNAYNARDVDAVLDLYATDALLSAPGLPLVRGKRAIGDFLRPRLAGFDDSGLRVRDEPVDEPLVSGDLAWHWQTFQILNDKDEEVDGGQLGRCSAGRTDGG